MTLFWVGDEIEQYKKVYMSLHGIYDFVLLLNNTKDNQYNDLNRQNRKTKNTLWHTAYVPDIRKLSTKRPFELEFYKYDKWPSERIKRFWLYAMHRFFYDQTTAESIIKEIAIYPKTMAMETIVELKFDEIKKTCINNDVINILKRPQTKVYDNLIAKLSNKTTTTGEFIMGTDHITEVKQQILINGRRAEDLSTDCLMGLVINTEKELKRLDDMQTESKTIAKMKERLESNIAKVVEIMDSREA